MTQIDPKDAETMLVCTFRYALGRQSYITAEAVDFIKRYKEYVSDAFLEQFCSDIAQQGEKLPDREHWLRFVTWCHGEIDRRHQPEEELPELNAGHIQVRYINATPSLVNQNPAGVRVTHLPSGLFADSTEHRSRHKNRMSAIYLLRKKLAEEGKK
tara:strand:+ start:51931 stop:52398 length:468 start_codon:yes stop_codon:yes gene_type:complete